ncbi:MAG: maleylpyruvate isomerase family mycothiol-dependent enzyme [Pseudonocardiales bacterium]|nr:maleylpyruvate isomerase family mycothiol-dependent enzyme [Pseudonocardiales bacterium]MBV9030769.1 maleylpyruvate isomerase family mycothiol-dependent enzyme [Pseudonocardiales bacterium]
MVSLRTDRHLDALTAQSALFAEALHDADLWLRVPTCPDWTLYRLTEHLGQAHRWATAIITRRATAPLDPSALGVAAAPEDPDGLGTWLREGAGALVNAVRAAGPQAPVWSWADDQSVGFWGRRMAHETVVHRADAELALGREFTVEAELAADVISEWLSLLCLPHAVELRPELAALRGEGQILHLHSTDPGLDEAGEWIVRRTPSGPVWEPGHAKGDVAVRGAVVDLLLVLMRRVPPAEAPVTVLGDGSVLEHWLEHTRF